MFSTIVVQNRKLRAGKGSGNSRGEREEQPYSLAADGEAQRLPSPARPPQHSDMAESQHCGHRGKKHRRTMGTQHRERQSCLGGLPESLINPFDHSVICIYGHRSKGHSVWKLPEEKMYSTNWMTASLAQNKHIHMLLSHTHHVWHHTEVQEEIIFNASFTAGMCTSQQSQY